MSGKSAIDPDDGTSKIYVGKRKIWNPK